MFLNKKILRDSNHELKRGIFPNAIHTNLLSKCDVPIANKNRALKKKKSNYDSTYSKNNDNATSVSSISLINKNLSPTSVVNEMPLFQSVNDNKYSSPITKQEEYHFTEQYQENKTLLNKSNLKNTRTMKNMKKDIIKFQVYDAEEAQQILLYREYGEILNKTLIIQKVNYFEDFVYDTMQELQDKLWRIRSLRDEHYSSKIPTVDGASNNSLPYNPLKNIGKFPTSTRNNAEIFTEVNAQLSEDKYKMSFKNFLSHNNQSKQDNFKSFKVLNDTNHNEHKKCGMFDYLSNNIAKSPKNEKRNKVLFDSTMISTNLISYNMTLHPIEFLENISKEQPIHSKKSSLCPLKKDLEKKLDSHTDFLGSPLCEIEFSSIFNNPSTSCQKNATELFKTCELNNKEFHEHRVNPMSLEITNNCSNDIMNNSVISSQNCFSLDELLKTTQNLNYILPSSVTNKTPEMKYYPRRLY
ncbi:hypothetical protein PGB90_008777 [Kerria lacca]